MSEEDCDGFITVSQTPHMDSLKEALLSLNKYHWYKLYLVEIHPDFQTEIMAEVKRLASKSAIERWDRRRKWLSSLQLRRKEEFNKIRCGH